MNSDFSELIYSTFLGGNDPSRAFDIAIDNSGCAYIGGITWANDFPVTKGAFQTELNNRYEDIFVTKLNNSGAYPEYSTFVGGNGFEVLNSIYVDENNCIYITGRANYSDYPVTDKTLMDKSNYHLSEVILTKFNSSGTDIEYSVLIGGRGNDEGMDIYVDNKGMVYITGRTSSDEYPCTEGTFQNFRNGTYDAFVTKFNPNRPELLYSTYLGGSSSEWPFSLEIDKNGDAYITGSTPSNDFPTTPDAFQTDFVKYNDVFITKLGLYPSNSINIEKFKTPICIGSTIDIPYNVYGTYNPGNSFTAQLSDFFGRFDSPTDIGSIQSTSSGTISAEIPHNLPPGSLYRVRIISSDPVIISSTTCDSIEILPLPEVYFGKLDDICQYDKPLTLNQGEPEGGYYQGDGMISNVFYPEDAGVGSHDIFYYYADENGCENSADQTINVLPAPEKPQIFQKGKVLVSSAVNGNQWYMNNIIINGAVHQNYEPDTTGYYSVQVTGDNGCESEPSEPYFFDISIGVKETIRQNQIIISPNPATEKTYIQFNLVSPGNIKLIIYDYLGQQIEEIYSGFKNTGQQIIEYDSGRLSPGVYFCTLYAGGYVETVKMVVVR